MVSIRGSLTLVALAVGVVLFFGAGGFKGVGQKIGGFFGQGFSDFSSSISSSFTRGLFGGQTGAANVVNAEGGRADPFGIPPALNPITSQLSIFQGIIDSFGQLFNFGQQAFGDTPLRTSNQRNLAFAISQLRPGQTISDITNRGRQGTAVSRTGQRFISNLGGRERAFGSQESLNSFIERFNR